MTTFDITVVTPTHLARMRNGKLSRAMESVYNQTLPAAAISVAVDLDGEGAPPTRQRALDAVRTPWTAFLDSDDVFLPKHLQWLAAHAQETGADFVYSWFKILQEGPDGTSRILEDDPIFPITHYLNPFNPDDPIETTITTLVRTDLAQSVGFHALNRGEANTGEDYGFLLGCLKAGAKVSHLVRKSWLWSHHQMAPGVLGNSGGRHGHGDAAG